MSDPTSSSNSQPLNGGGLHPIHPSGTRISGAYLVMPLLLVSMGGEMVYILQQRLDAQKISAGKGKKVLHDVLKSMFFPRFIQELFRPQDTFSLQSTRQIFDRLAHSSIMRLNSSSMDKLCDLMCMGFKLQFLSCSCAEDLVDVALNHLDACKRIAEDNQEIFNLILQCEHLIHTHYDEMSAWDFRELKNTLGGFFHDRRVKVSLFLQDEVQNSDGSIIVQLGGVLPFNTLPQLGCITYVQQDFRQEFVQLVSSGPPPKFWVNENRLSRINIHGDKWTTLGTNLYSKDRTEARAKAQALKKQQKKDNGNDLNGTGSGGNGGSSNGNLSQEQRAVVGELNSLASLIAVPKSGGEDEIIRFDNLFGNDILVERSTFSPTFKGGTLNRTLDQNMANANNPNSFSADRTVKIDNNKAHQDHRSELDALKNDFDVDNGGSGQNGTYTGASGVGPSAEEQDLLDLLG